MLVLQIHNDTHGNRQWSTRWIDTHRETQYWAIIQSPARSSCIIPFGCSSFFPCLFPSFLIPFPSLSASLFVLPFLPFDTIGLWYTPFSLLLTQPTQPNPTAVIHPQSCSLSCHSHSSRSDSQFWLLWLFFVVVFPSLYLSLSQPLDLPPSLPPLSSFLVPLYLAFSLLFSPSLPLSLALSPSLVCSLVPCTYTTTHAHTSYNSFTFALSYPNSYPT